MEKRISFFNFQSVRAVAKAIDPHLRTMDTLKKKALAVKEEYDEKLAKLNKELDEKAGKIKQEYDACETQINALEAGILQVTGFHVADLVKKVIEPTGKTDPKTGKPLKVTKYIPTSIVTYDEQAKEFIVTTPDEGANTTTASTEEPSTVTEAPVDEVPTTEDVAGSDFDKDAEYASDDLPFGASDDEQTDSIFD